MKHIYTAANVIKPATWLYSLLALAIIGFSNCSKSDAGQAANGVITYKIDRSSEIYQKAVHSPVFLQACEALTVDGEMFDENSAVYTAKEGRYEVAFAVINEETGKPGVYQKLVFAAEGERTAAYFDEKNAADTLVTGSLKLKWPPTWWPGGGSGGSGGSGSGGSGFCWHWNNWVVTGYFCGYSFPCVFNNQQAKFRTEERTCKNNPNNKQTRTVKVHCGC